MSITFTQNALAHFPLAPIWQTIEPFYLAIFVILIIFTVVACAGMVLMAGRRPISTLVPPVLVSTALFVTVLFVHDDFQGALLYDAQGEAFGTVASFAESGGGCTPTRTAITKADGSSFTLKGSLSLSPGDSLTKKTIASGDFSGDFVCRADGAPTDCLKL